MLRIDAPCKSELSPAHTPKRQRVTLDPLEQPVQDRLVACIA